MSHDLESVWELREEALYPSLFGSGSRGIFVLEKGDFAALGCDAPDPRWMTLGVFEFSPTPERESWAYVTSGGSTPWEGFAEEPEGWSWLGVEFLLETTAQADWAIRLLKRLFAFHVLAMHGFWGERPGLAPGICLPIRSALDGAGSQLDFVLATGPMHVPGAQRLPSGRFDLVQLVGVAAAEAEFGKLHGVDRLVENLRAAGAAPVTDAARSPLVLA